MLCTIIFWLLFGWLADYSFPFGQALDLLLSCFRGTVSAKINNLQQQLQKIDITSQPGDIQKVQNLNNLESQAWLYKGVLERLVEDPSVNHEKIAKTIEALTYKRSQIARQLEPRRPRSYRFFSKVQDSARGFLASQAERDYEQLNKIVSNLIIFANSRRPSQVIISEVIKQLSTEIVQSSDKISLYRLRLAYKIDELMKVISSRLILGSNGSQTDSSYRSVIDELESRNNLLLLQINKLNKAKQETAAEISRYIRETSNLNQKISDLSREVSRRDVFISSLQNNIQDLAEVTRENEDKIIDLKRLISELEKDSRNSKEVEQEKQIQIRELNNQLSQLEQEKRNLQKRVQEITEYALSKESEFADLQDEKHRLDLQKLDLQRQYQALGQNHQQKQNEIDRLRKQLEELLKSSQSKPQPYIRKPSQSVVKPVITKPTIPVKDQSKPQPSTRKPSQSVAKPVITKPTISVNEWKRISNQSDYVYVKPYPKKNGTLVGEHYRRRPKRRK